MTARRRRLREGGGIVILKESELQARSRRQSKYAGPGAGMIAPHPAGKTFNPKP